MSNADADQEQAAREARVSAVDDLALHGVRVLGFTSASRVAVRFAGRYSSALAKVDGGQRAWVDAHDRDSCHTLWIQFREDLLAPLGIPRGSDG